MNSANSISKTRLFLSYAPSDEVYKEELLDHLKNLERQGQIQTWDASKIVAGSVWKTQRENQLQNAEIVLLLISPDAIANDDIFENEIQKALQNAESGKQILLPILIRPVNYQGFGIEKYLVLPSNGKAVSEWKNPDKAYEHIVQHLQRIIEKPQQLLADDAPKEVMIEKDPPSQNDLKTKLWQSLTAIGVVVALLAGIAEISGYSLRDFFDSNTASSLTEPFDVTVFVHGEQGKQDMILRQKGKVIMDFSGDRRSEPIDDDGKVTFRNIPTAKAKDSVLLNIDFSEPLSPYKSPPKICPHSLYRYLFGGRTARFGESVWHSSVQKCAFGRSNG